MHTIAVHSYNIMYMLGMSVLCKYATAAFSHISAKYACHIFPHKLAFSMAVLILLKFLLPISIRFFYLDHLVAMCPSIHVSGPQWNEMT